MTQEQEPREAAPDTSAGRRLVDHLLAHPEQLPFPAQAPTLVETHSAWVLLCGEDALKIKKAVHFGFIDFSTLARRDRCAREEIRLNRRLAPELYLDVLPVTGTPEAPRFDGVGPLLETAVHMRQFDPAGTLDRELEAGNLCADDIDAVAQAIADFQADAPRVEAADPWGRFDSVLGPVRENFVRVREAAADLADLEPRLAALEVACEALGARLREPFAARRAGGFVREGHGDLHLGNIARTRFGIRAFDALEFAPALRWLDVVSDLAFLHTDLIGRGRADLGWHLINAWVERTGDHAGLRLLRFYVLYRTMVRVKVAALRRAQHPAGAQRDGLEAELRHWLALAEGFLAQPAPVLVLMHGPSGAGKSHLARPLADRLGAVHLRSDVERKRLLTGVAPGHLYDDDASALTYRHLLEVSRGLLRAGASVVVDATFLTRARRTPFRELATQLQVPLAIVVCTASTDVLQARVAARSAAGRDASDADADVVRAQQARIEPPAADEATQLLGVPAPGTSDPDAARWTPAELAARIRALPGSDL